MLVVYYQERDGPVNYRNISKSALFDVTLLGGSPAVNQYDYPLVTVEISTGIRQLINTCIHKIIVETITAVTSSVSFVTSSMSHQCCDEGESLVLNLTLIQQLYHLN